MKKTNPITLLRPFYLVILAFVVYSCGTTSSIHSSDATTSNLDLSNYENVVVELFSDGTKKSNVPNYFLEKFQQQIIASIKEKDIFNNVSAEVVDSTTIPKTLFIKGSVTRYEEGDPTARLLIGLGEGSSYLDAKIHLVDSATKKQIGEIIVDKNSWGLGGLIAANQTVETFMVGAAKKIASELEKLNAPKTNLAL